MWAGTLPEHYNQQLLSNYFRFCEINIPFYFCKIMIFANNCLKAEDAWLQNIYD